jgi:hypothetical protein
MSRPLDAAFEFLRPHLISGASDVELTAAKCYGLIVGYDARWHDAPYLIDAVESVVSSDLYNPVTTRKSRYFTVAGKIDLRVREIPNGERLFFDHKTTQHEIQDPAAPFWKQLIIEGQVNHYYLLEWINGRKVDGAIWDAVRKPYIAPKLLSKSEAAALTGAEDGTYYNFALDKQEIERFEANSGRETPIMYMARLCEDTMYRPDWYYQRRKVPKLDSEVHDYALELWGHAKDILAARKANRHPRNGRACFNYGTPCRYLGICSGYDSPDSDRWIKAEWVHPELPILNAGQAREDPRGTNIITNSRIGLFQTCRRKHFYTYEMGIEKLDEEEVESRFFGTLYHDALEQYFLELQSEQQKHPVSVLVPHASEAQSVS